MFKACPDSVDVTELQFKLQCRLKVFENVELSTFSNTSSLLTCASRYGLLFVGTNNKEFQVIETQTLQKYSPKDKDVINYPRRNIELPSSPKHLCVNCDSTILAVVTEKDQCSVVIFYDVISFLSQNIKIIKEIRLSSTPNVYVREINWNPALPGVFTACKGDGSLGVYELKGNSVDINELPVAAGATCFCWSPKGKQIAVGSKDGKITQYKPDLKAVKVINEPKFENLHSLISLQWISNYQFIGVYQSMQTEGSPCVIVIDAPKTGEPSYTNYDDICYSGSSRPAQFYLILQQNWNFLMVASANSTEVGVLGGNGDSWTQWIMSDTARAELPLSVDHQETFPVGLAFDISSTTPLPWGESSIPPCPLLCVLSHHGVLCCFNVVYLKEGIPSVCTPPDSVQDKSGLSSFVAASKFVTEVVKPKSVQPSPLQLQFGLGNTQSSVENLVVSKENSFLVPKPTFLSTTTAQSTPLFSGKPTLDTSSKVLFGGAATITPIKPQQPSQGVSLFAGQTSITQLGKGSNVNTSISSSSLNQPSNTFSSEKYSSIFSSLNPSTLAPTNTLPVKPIVIGGTSAIKPEATVKAPEKLTSKLLEGPVIHETKPALTPKQELQTTDPKIKAETSAMLAQMVRDEWMYLEAELKVFINQGRNIKINLGTEEEKVDMITQIDSLQEFVKEAVETSVCQSNEIHCLKQNLIQAWAWFEEANSYYNSTKNEAVALLLKLQPLDSVTEKRLKEIEQLSYYIESQLQQASKTLDEEWGNFQDYAKKTHRVEMPTMETIFQTMVKQSAILQKQTYVLKDISMRLKKKTLGVSSLLLSMDKADSLADDFRQLRLDPQDILKLQYEKIKNHTKILSNKKANMLRNLLKQREVTHITAVRPQISSWAINQSPTNRTRHSVSILGAQMSPVSKTSIAKNINFNQSTPVKVSESLKANEISQGIRVSMGSTEKPSFTVASNTLSSSSGFVSLAKSGPVISSSQGSAFAPIGFTATSSSKPFSFGTASAVSSVSQVKSSFSSPSFFNTTAITTGPSGNTTTSTGIFSSLKSPTETTAIKPQSTTTVSSGFSFSFGSSAPSKNVLAVTSTSGSPIVGNVPASANNPNSNNMFSTSSNVFNSAKTQEVKTAGIAIPGTKSDVNLFQTPTLNIFNSQNTSFNKPVDAVPTGDKGMTLRETNVPSNIFGSHQSSFTSISKSPSVTTIPSISSTATPPRSSSGVASIFANLQSVIDNAVGSTEIITTTTDSLKSTFQFSTAKGAVATTTQSIFGAASLSASKPVFGTGAAATTESGFGNMSKPVESFTLPSTTLSSAGGSNNSLSATLPTSKSEILATGLNQLLLSADTKLAENSAISKSVERSVVPTTIQQPGFGQKNIVSSSNADINATSEGLVAIPTAPNQTVFGDDGKITSKSEQVVVGTFQTATTTNLTNATDMFGSLKPATAVSSSTFGTTQSGSIFSGTTSSNIFGGNASTATTSSNIFSSVNSGTIFGNVATPTPTSTANIFGAQTSAANVIGTPAASKSIFGAPPAPSTTSFATTTTTSVFATSAAAPNIFSSSNSVFGGTPTVSSSNVFGSQTSSSSSVFGAQTTATSSIFSTTTSTPAANMFGGITPASTTSNIFASAASAAPPPFGSQSSSIFGAPTTTTAAFSAFGNQPSTAAPVFGQKTTFGSGTPGFGATTTTTSGNIFGSSSSTSSQFGSGFGGTTTTSTFESQPNTQAPPTGSFGFGGLNVGNSSSTTGSIFGGNSGGTFGATQTPNPFAKVENKLPFGSGSTNVFGNSPSPSATTNIFASPTPTASSNIFGSSSGTGFGTSSTGAGFGSPSTFGSSAFGQPAAFGSNTFGSPQTGAFSGGSASPIAQTGFGSPAAFPKPASAFGSPAAFGGAPAFGSAPSFGGSPAFGAAPSFGSPEKVFGSSPAASGGFGAAAAPQSAGFGNLATQNTIGFGNLAQQANTPSTSPFSGGNTSFTSWR